MRLVSRLVVIVDLGAQIPLGKAAPDPSRDESSKLFERLRQHEDHLEHKAQKLSELQAMAMGLARNQLLAQGYAEIEAAQWQTIAIRREWVPTILGKNDSPGLVGIETTRSNNEIFYGRYLLPEVQLQWTFFDPGRTPRTKASLASLQASRLLFDISARNLILNIQQTYAELQKQRDLEKSYSELAKLTYALVKVARERGSNSDSSESERGQLAAEELDLLIFKINSHEQVIRQAAELARLLSLPPGDLAMPSDPLRQQGRWDLSLKQTIDQALALREEIKASLAESEQFGWNAKEICNQVLPSFWLQASSGLEGDRYTQRSMTKSGRGMSTSRTQDAGLYFNWPLEDGGISAALATAERKRAIASNQQAELDRLAIVAEVQISHAAYISSLIVISSANDQLRESSRAIEAASHAFRRGEANATTVIQAIGNHRKAISSYGNAVEKHNSSIAQLYRYSARWPETALPLLQRRVESLRRQEG
jgi:outer membrane protein TolC